MRTLATLALVIGCGGSKPAPTPPPTSPQPVAPAPVAETKPAETKPEPPPPPPEPAKPAVADAPWAAEPLDAAKVPKVYATEYGKAKNKATCPLLVITDFGGVEGAKPRAANFAGGWAVAYDTKKQRSAFGVAGAGVEKGGGPSWPNKMTFSDGSTVGYGPEGGTGPKSLAYVEVSDAGCLYNVWSMLGEDHLVQIIKSLRHVK